MTRNTYLELKLLFQKSLWKTFYWSNKDTRKVKDFQKLSNKEIYCTPHFNSTKCGKLWNSFHGQTFLKDTIFSALKFGVKMLLISLRNAMMDIYFLTLQYIEWEMHQIICVSDIKNEESLTPILYSTVISLKLL